MIWIGQWLFSALGVTAILLGVGCMSVSPGKQGEAVPAQPERIEINLPAARVIRVNPQYGYVVLDCESMPIPGDRAQVYNAGKKTATLRITARRRGKYVIADVIEGHPRQDDIVKYTCVFYEWPEKEK